MTHDVYWLLPLLGLLANLALIVILSARGAPTRDLKVYSGFLAATTLWNLGSVIMRTNASPGLEYMGARLAVSGILFISIFYLHSVACFTRQRDPLLPLAYATNLIFLPLIWGSPWVLSGVFNNTWGPVGKAGPLWIFFTTNAYFYPAYAMYRLYQAYRASTDPFRRNRYRYLLLGFCIYAAGTVTDYLTTLSIPYVFPLGSLAQTINTFIIFFAITRHQLLDISLFLESGLIYSLMTAGFTGAVVIIVSLAGSILGQRWVNASRGTLAFILTAGIALGFNPLRQWLQRHLDSLFFRSKLNYQEALLGFTKSIAALMDPEHLTSQIPTRVGEILQTEHAFLLLHNPASGSYDLASLYLAEAGCVLGPAALANRETPVPEAGGNTPEWLEERLTLWRGAGLADQGGLVDWMGRRGVLVTGRDEDFVPEFKLLPQPERAWLEERKVALLIPLALPTHLVGILGLGRMRSGAMCSPEDLKLLSIVAHAATISLENARLYAQSLEDVRQSKIFSEFTQQLNSSLHLPEIYNLAGRAICRMLDADRVCLFLLNHRTGSLDLCAESGGPNEPEPRQLSVGIDLEPIPRVIGKGEVLNLPESRAPAGLEAALKLGGSPSGTLLAPLLVKGKANGLLAAFRLRAQAPFTRQEADLIFTLAHQTAIAIEKSQLYDEVRHEHQVVQQLLKESIRAQEEERKRVAMEIHDTVAQGLVGAFTRVQAMQHLLRTDGAHTEEELEELRSEIHANLKEIRRIISDLRPSVLEEMGLAATLGYALRGFQDETGISASIRSEDIPRKLDGTLEVAVYRIVQEALNNIKKHAQASSVLVALEMRDNELILHIKDDGIGFDLSRFQASPRRLRHFGLLGMKERATLMGGSLEVWTHPGRGCVLSCRLPLERPTPLREGVPAAISPNPMD